WSKQRNQNLIHTIDPAPGSAIACAKHSVALTEDLAQQSGTVIRIPGNRESRADAALEWRVRILQMQVAGSFESENRSKITIISCAWRTGQCRCFSFREKSVRVHEATIGVYQLNLCSILLNRRGFVHVTQPVAERQRRLDTPGIGAIAAVVFNGAQFLSQRANRLDLQVRSDARVNHLSQSN